MTELETCEAEIRTLEEIRAGLQFVWIDLSRVRYPTDVLKNHLTDAIAACDNLLKSYNRRIQQLKDQHD